MIRITKKDAKVLHKEYGVKYGEKGISHTYSKNKHYYLCENEYCMNAYRRLQDSIKRTVYQ